MSLSDLAAIGSLLSATAVVFSLIFLSLQIRQANKNQRSLMQQGRTARRVELLMRRAEPYLSDIIVRASQGDLTLEAAQIAAYLSLIQAIFEGYEDSFLQYQAGALDSSSWQTELVSMRSYFANAVTRIAWQRLRNEFAGDFRDFTDNLLQATKAVKPADVAAAWRAVVEEELARL